MYLKESNFEDFPERFHQNDWKVTFFHNRIIPQITRRQLNHKILEQFDSRRKAYAQRDSETVSKNEKAKDEILKKIQGETLDAIGSLSEVEFERKNKDSLLIDNFIRDRYNVQKNHLKQVLGCKGPWRQIYRQNFKKAYYQSTGECAHSLMVDRPSNAFQFIDDDELEDQIFKKVYNRDEKSIDEYIVRQSNIDNFYKVETQQEIQSPLPAKDFKVINTTEKEI